MVVVVVLDAPAPNEKLGGLLAASEAAFKFTVGDTTALGVLSLFSEPKLKLRLGLGTAVTEVVVVEVVRLELVLVEAPEAPEPNVKAGVDVAAGVAVVVGVVPAAEVPVDGVPKLNVF